MQYSLSMGKIKQQPDYAALGRKGGKARLRMLSPAQRREIASKAGRARLRKLSPEQRREIARKAIRIRWARARAKRRAQEL